MYIGCKEVFSQVAGYVGNIEREYAGTSEFEAKFIHEVIKNKTRYIENPHGDGEGISQKLVSTDMQIDLSVCDWYVFNDNFGTTEEKRFVHYFSHLATELKTKYYKVYLLRNERFPELAIYDFDTAERFEPDYLLVLQKAKTDGYEQQQIFVEPKGTDYLLKDAWKEKFMLQMEKRAVTVKKYADDNEYKILGLPFYNAIENNDVFLTAMKKLHVD